MTKIFVASIALLILIGVIVLVNIPVHKTVCVTQYGSCPDYLQERTPSLEGTKWVEKVAPDTLTKAFAGLPEVKNITIEKKFPGVVTIDIALRKPMGVVYSTTNRAQVAADAEGILFETKDVTNLPRLVVDSPLEIGAKLSDSEFAALNDVYKASVIQQKNVTGKIVDSALEIKTDTNQVVIISLIRPDLDWQYSLQAILTRSKIDGKLPQKIDLRFEDPVVVY